MNAELGGNFDLDEFEHVALWDPDAEWIEMRLRSSVDQTVELAGLDLSVPFAAGEELRTEVSAKFRRDGVAAELAAAGLRCGTGGPMIAAGSACPYLIRSDRTYRSCVSDSTNELAELYRDTRVRLCALVSGLDDAAHGAAVPACPGWAVRDVVAHLTAIVEDALAGRLAGIPDEEFTAGQIARMADVPVAEMLDRWAAGAPQFEDAIQAFEIWPAVIDVATHEQDIRGAIGRPGARDCAAIRRCTPMLLDWLAPPVPVRIGTEDGDQVVGIR